MLAKTTPKEAFTHYLRKHVLTYTILSVMLILGVIFGALSAKVLPDEEKSELAQDLTAFFRGFGETMQVAGSLRVATGFLRKSEDCLHRVASGPLRDRGSGNRCFTVFAWFYHWVYRGFSRFANGFKGSAFGLRIGASSELVYNPCADSLF